MATHNGAVDGRKCERKGGEKKRKTKESSLSKTT
jgi:hypothetical protein